MTKTFTAEQIAALCPRNAVYEHDEGIAIAPRPGDGGLQAETFIIPRVLNVYPDLCTPVDPTTPLASFLASDLLHELGVADYADYAYDLSLRYGIHWLDGTKSMFKITRPNLARHIQLIAKVDRNYRLQAGLIDYPPRSEEILKRLSDYHYECWNERPYQPYKHQVFIIPCDYHTEAIQSQADSHWCNLYLV